MGNSVLVPQLCYCFIIMRISRHVARCITRITKSTILGGEGGGGREGGREGKSEYFNEKPAYGANANARVGERSCIVRDRKMPCETCVITYCERIQGDRDSMLCRKEKKSRYERVFFFFRDFTDTSISNCTNFSLPVVHHTSVPFLCKS